MKKLFIIAAVTAMTSIFAACTGADSSSTGADTQPASDARLDVDSTTIIVSLDSTKMDPR